MDVGTHSSVDSVGCQDWFVKKSERELFLAVRGCFCGIVQTTSLLFQLLNMKDSKRSLNRTVKRRPTHDHGRSSIAVCFYWDLVWLRCNSFCIGMIYLCQWENGLENIKYKSEESLKWSADTQSVMADVSCSTDNRSKTNIFVVLHARYKDSWSDLLPLHDGSDRKWKCGRF